MCVRVNADFVRLSSQLGGSAVKSVTAMPVKRCAHEFGESLPMLVNVVASDNSQGDFEIFDRNSPNRLSTKEMP
jgi:hypothetical protein